MPLYIAQSGDWVRCYRCLTHSQTLKDRATQLLVKYRSGALVTQLPFAYASFLDLHRPGRLNRVPLLRDLHGVHLLGDPLHDEPRILPLHHLRSSFLDE